MSLVSTEYAGAARVAPNVDNNNEIETRASKQYDNLGDLSQFPETILLRIVEALRSDPYVPWRDYGALTAFGRTCKQASELLVAAGFSFTLNYGRLPGFLCSPFMGQDTSRMRNTEILKQFENWSDLQGLTLRCRTGLSFSANGPRPENFFKKAVLGNPELEMIPSQESLKSLFLDVVDATDSGAKHLLSSPELKQLILRECANLTENLFDDLVSSSIQDIAIRDCRNMSLGGVLEKLRGKKLELNSLCLDGPKKTVYNQAAMRALASLNVKQLRISGWSNSFSEMKKNTKLESIEFDTRVVRYSKTSMRSLLETLYAMPALTSVSFDACGRLSDEVMSVIDTVAASHPSKRIAFEFYTPPETDVYGCEMSE